MFPFVISIVPQFRSKEKPQNRLRHSPSQFGCYVKMPPYGIDHTEALKFVTQLLLRANPFQILFCGFTVHNTCGIERELHRTLNATDAPAVRLNGNVLTCEFEQAKQQAVLEVSFEARKGKVFKHIKKRFTAAVTLSRGASSRKQAAAMASAMSSCFHQAGVAAAELIREINKE